MNKLCIQNYRMFLSTIASLGGCIHYSVSHSEVCTQHVTEIMIFPTISTHSLSDNFNTLSVCVRQFQHTPCVCQTISTHSLCVCVSGVNYEGIYLHLCGPTATHTHKGPSVLSETHTCVMDPGFTGKLSR